MMTNGGKEQTYLIRERGTDTQLGYVRAHNILLADLLASYLSTVRGKNWYLELPCKR